MHMAVPQSSMKQPELPTVRPASPVPLPRWAQQGLHGDTVHVGDEEEGDEGPPDITGDLPAWARKGLDKCVISCSIVIIWVGNLLNSSNKETYCDIWHVRDRLSFTLFSPANVQFSDKNI